MSSLLEHSGFKWVNVRAIERLNDLHMRLESPGLDMESTNLLRGQIQEVRRCIEDAERSYKGIGPEISDGV